MRKTNQMNFFYSLRMATQKANSLWAYIIISLSIASLMPLQAVDISLLANWNYIPSAGDSIINFNDSQTDSVSIPIIVLTDTDSSPGSHTISYGTYSRSTVTFTVGANGVISGGATVDTIPIGASNPGYVMPPSYTLGQSPPTVNTNFTVYLDYNSSTGQSVDSKPISIQSNYRWNKHAYGGSPDPTLGWLEVYLDPPRKAASTSQPIYLYLPGATKQDPNGKSVYPGCSTGPGCPNCQHMAIASLDRFQAGISISDAPVGYTPPVGRDMSFQITYHQRLSNQPSTFNFSNLGNQWGFSWLSYISGGPPNNLLSATYFEPGGSQYFYGGYQQNLSLPNGNNQGDFQDNQGWNLATLHYRQGPERYERWLPDGTVEVYAQGVGTSPNRLFFLTSITDPQGNKTTLSYNASAASSGNALLMSVTDPLGKQLVFSYGSSDPLKITKVTRTKDGLSAKFEYSGGQLTSSTDTIGITSQFHYGSGTNFIDSMTTPYGTTTFHSSDGSGYLEADMTNPLGDNERVEYQEALTTSQFPATESSAPSVPGTTFSVDNSNLNHANSFYWNRRAMADAATAGVAPSGSGSESGAFYALAQVTHWAKSSLGSVPVPLSTKMPLEGRVWYNYPGQPDFDTVDVTAAGAMVQPSATARVLDDFSTQASFASYYSNGMIENSIDASGHLSGGSWAPGRSTLYTYYSNGIDLHYVQQANGSGLDTLSTMTYNGIHEPLTITDASGQVTTMTYDTTYGQLLTRKNAKNETTTLVYNANRYLSSVTGPASGSVTLYTYDAAGRVQTVKDSEGYVVTTAYDNLDRPTKVTYPDGTTDQTFYNKLDVDHTVDRQGRTTQNVYDAIRELMQTTDPANRTTKYTWCKCGGLSTLTDADLNVTQWDLDLQGRVIYKTYGYTGAHNASTIGYAYESTTSRLHTMTDAKTNLATYSYNPDNTLAGTAYTVTTDTSAPKLTSATPSVGFYYDPVYNRVTKMRDIVGTTNYDTIYLYNPITGSATTGAGRLDSVTVPIEGTTSTATVAYRTSGGAAGSGYDQLGRVVSRTVDGASAVGTAFDSLGRVTNVTNPLGAFTYAYVRQTSRLGSVTYPSGTGLSTNYSYLGNTGDQRLQTIQNMHSTTQLSKFDYTYNPVGTIATWTQQPDSSTAVLNTLTYDNADQLTSAVQSGGGTASNAYHYDPSGNRLAEVTGSGTTAGRFNNLNQLTGITSSATSQPVAGHTNASITSATVNAFPATITSGTNFSATVPLPTGTNILNIAAQPTSGSKTTQLVQVVLSGTAPTLLSYDYNGNCIQDENGNKYYWDALNRLTAIAYFSGTYSGTHTEMAYDGLSRRIQIVERAGTTVGSGTASSTKNFLWIGSEIAEERQTISGTLTVTKRFFPQGEQQIVSGTTMPYYYTRDHLGSVRELCSSTGTITSRMAYDSYGRVTVVSGTNLPTFGYADYYQHQASGLDFTLYRAYDANTGRWLSRDPLADPTILLSPNFDGASGRDGIRFNLKIPEIHAGPNVYEYVRDNPDNKRDPLGLQACTTDCTKAPPLLDSSPECDKYGNETYLMTGLKCFCKNAGNSDWSQKVRGCLRCERDKNTNPFVAHIRCYAAGGSSAPYITLAVVYTACVADASTHSFAQHAIFAMP